MIASLYSIVLMNDVDVTSVLRSATLITATHTTLHHHRYPHTQDNLGKPAPERLNQGLRSLFAVARPSVVCLSDVCNVRAPSSGGSNFRQYFYGIRYLGHPLISTENFMEIVLGEPLCWGELNTRGWAKYSDFGPIDGYISETVQVFTGGKLLFITNRKSYMSFRLVPKSVTLNDLERRNGVILRYLREIG